MTTLVSAATGNFTAAATWQIADSTSLINTIEASTSSSTSFVNSVAFVPGAITIDAIGVFVASRIASPIGTFTFELYNTTTATTIAGTTLTVSAMQPGACWYQYQFAPVTLTAGQNYVIRVKSSTSAEVTVYRSAATANWSRFLRTTTTAAPGAGDSFIVVGLTDGTAIDVTMDNTTGTIFGAVASNTPSLSISKNGSFKYGVAASTNYRFKHAGFMWVLDGGVYHRGTNSSPIPSTSTATHEISPTSNADSGIECWSGGYYEACGTLTGSVVQCLLAADIAATATALTSDVSTGWKQNDVIVIAPTTRVASEGEERVLSVDASGTSLTLSAGVTYAHSGAVNRRAEIINLTRNNRVFGTSNTICGYIYGKTGSTVIERNTENYFLGTNTGVRRGVYMENNTSYFENCSFHDYYVTISGASGLLFATVGFTATAKNCVFWKAGYVSLYSIAISCTAATYESNCVIGVGAASTYGMLINSAGASVINNRASGCAASINITGAAMIKMGTVSGNVAHSCTGGPVYSGIADSLISSTTSWRTGGQGVTLTGCINTWLDTVDSVGHTSSSLSVGGNQGCGVLSATGCGETGFTQPYSLYVPANNVGTIIANSVFGGAGAPQAATNGDIVFTGVLANIVFHNTQFLSPTEHFPSVWGAGNGYQSEKHDGVAGSNKWVRWEGTIVRDTVIFNDGTSSMRMTPATTLIKLKSPTFQSAVLSGATRTITVEVRKSVVGDGTAYNGAEPRLIVKANPVAGILADTVLDTASGAAGSWETLSGTSPAVAESTRLEFYVDCDGTNGWVNIDTVTVASDDMASLEIYTDGHAYVTGGVDTSNFTDVPTDRVDSTYSWKYNSSINNRTGTRVQPTTGTVQIGVTYGPSSGLTGTYDGSDRYTDPGIANVRNGTAYQFNSLTNNRTGDVTIPTTGQVQIGVTYDTLLTLTGTYVAAERYSDPGVGTVEVGTTYQFNSLTNNRTGTYDGSNRHSDPGDANVRDGVTYQSNSLTPNKTGRVVSPAVYTVLAGVGYDTDSATTGTMAAVTPTTVLQLSEIWQRLGLDAANPLDTNNTTGVVTVGSITMQLTGTASHSVLTRQP